jgi:hypothetical protein
MWHKFLVGTEVIVSNRDRIAAVQRGMSVFDPRKLGSDSNGGTRSIGRGRPLIVCRIEHKKALAEKSRLARIAVEYGQFTCYDFSVLDSDRHVAA